MINFLTVILIAVGLSMDAFAVSIVSGASCRNLKIRHALRIAVFFGFFQAVMPLIGYLAGISIKGYIEGYDHWMSFFLLCAVGVKMIYESCQIKHVSTKYDPSNIAVLLVLSIATSIDALAIGLTISLMVNSVIISVAVIGGITFVLSYIGVLIGKRFGHFFENKIEAFGGLVLIGLGLKILLEHMPL